MPSMSGYVCLSPHLPIWCRWQKRSSLRVHAFNSTALPIIYHHLPRVHLVEAHRGLSWNMTYSILTPLHPLGIFRLCATDENVVEGDVDELDDITDGTHNQEADTDSLRDLDEFLAVGLLGLVDELDAVLEELARQVEDFLDRVGHCGGGYDATELRTELAPIEMRKRWQDSFVRVSRERGWIVALLVITPAKELAVTKSCDPYPNATSPQKVPGAIPCSPVARAHSRNGVWPVAGLQLPGSSS